MNLSARFPVLDNKVQISTETAAGDQFQNGVLLDGLATVVRVATGTPSQWQNGLPLSATGQLIYVDATAGLPAGTTYQNGIPLSPAGAVCISTAAAVAWQNGLPFVANGALAAQNDLITQLQAIFASGDQGLIYDPSNLATLFKESTGTTPVAVASDPVGLVLDQRYGGARGPELVTNGNFSNGATGWTLGSGWSVGGGSASISGNAGSSLLTLTGGIGVTVTGDFYEVEFDYNITTGRLRFNPVVGNATTLLTAGSGRFGAIVPVVSSGTQVVIQAPDAASVAAVGNISVKRLPGNPALQATGTARPFWQTNRPRIDFDVIDDALVTTFPVSLGSSCTVGRSVPGSGASILTAQTIGTSYTDSTDHCGLFIINRALTAPENAVLTAWLNQQAGV